MKTFFQFAIAILFLSSCAKESDNTLQSFYSQNAVTKTLPSTDYETEDNSVSGNMTIKIITTARTEVNITVSNVIVTYLSEANFIVVTNPGTLAQQTFTATEATITEPDTKLKVTKNPGVNQITYSDKSTCYITASTANQLIVSIQPGNITTNALSIVGDENDGL